MRGEVKRADSALRYFGITAKVTWFGRVKVKLGSDTYWLDLRELHVALIYRTVLELALKVINTKVKALQLGSDMLSAQLGR